MKRYILFFISIGLIVGIVFVYSTINVEESKKVIFTESGYILNGASDKYYFNQEETYTTTYNKQISFLDTQGAKVTLGEDNFVHYSSGNILALQDGVLLDLSKLSENPIIYYNISGNKEIKKMSYRYIVKNLNTDIQFEQAIWKISANKYIILGNNFKINLNNGTEEYIDDYIEIEYSDNEVVTIYNQKVNYQTISSNSYIELRDFIKLNLGEKIVSQNDENKMSLEDMVINSDDNVTIIDINQNYKKTEENAEENEDENKTEEENSQNNNESSVVINNNEETKELTTETTTTIKGASENKNDANENMSNSINTNNTVTNNTTENSTNTNNTVKENTVDTNIIDGNTTSENETSENNTVADENVTQNKIIIDTPEILYEYISDGETKVDTTVTLAEPKFRLENMELSSVGITGEIQITDEDDLLSKDNDIVIQIINNATGRTACVLNESYGTFNIPLNIETLLPNTSYSLIASAVYTINESEYAKNFLYKTFETLPVGFEIEKEAYTDSALYFNLKFTDSQIEDVTVSLLDASGAELPNRSQLIRNLGDKQTFSFESLSSNTDYTVKVSNATYAGVVQEGENWTKYYTAKTLKATASINDINYSINKRDGTFKLFINDVEDNNNSIQNYQFIVYNYKEYEDDDGNIVLGYDTKNVAYKRETTSKEITITVADEESGENIVRNEYYGFKVIATTYDNEKYVEIESNICGAFALKGKTFPVVKFERLESEYPPTEIQGWLYIIDEDNTISVDSDNPLTITYYSDVDENKVYKKLTTLDAEEKTKDSDGNSVIKLFIDLGESGDNKKGLKKETSYTFSVYGTVNLKDDNEEYKNSYIGSAIVTTTDYNNVVAKLNTTEIASNTFTVELSLEGDDVIKRGLSSVDIKLYEGSGDINAGEYKNWSRTITQSNYASCKDMVKYDTEVNSLEDLLFKNTLLITPSFIGGDKESSYTELNYQILVTATVDGTNYSNKIPIKAEEDDNDNTGDTTFTDKKTKENYSAAYIIVKGKGTTARVTEGNKEIHATAIKNSDAKNYGLEKNENLDDSTFIGYFVDTDFINTGSLIAKEITYYVWDEDGNPVLDGNNKPLTKTLNIVNQEKIPTAIFELNQGTVFTEEEDNKTGMHRGDAYFFSYTITYSDNNGKDILWPLEESGDDESYTNQTLKTDILYPNKQEPSFVLYPKTSNNNSITYVYSCKDIDNALSIDGNMTYSSLSNKGKNEIGSFKISTDGNFHEIILQNLDINKKFEIEYNKNLNKAKNKKDSEEVLTKQYFEGIVDCKDVSIREINYNEEENPNNIKIILDGNKINRIAAAQVTFSRADKSITTKLLKIQNEYDDYCINIDVLDLVENHGFADFIGIDIGVSVKIYYDNGVIGFEPENHKDYAIYENSESNYMSLDQNNNFVQAQSINGNMYRYSFETSNDRAILGLMSTDKVNDGIAGNTLSLMYSPQGLKQNGYVIVQKQIDSMEINQNNTINIQNLRMGVSVKNITSTLNTAKIIAEISNVLNENIKNLTIEMWHSKDKDASPQWEQAEVIEFNIDDIENIELNDLSPAEFYSLRFKYKENSDSEYLYMFDIDTKEIGKIYTFETVATIGARDIKVQYIANNYIDKYLNISYRINKERSKMYEKIKYTFYKEKTKEKVELTEQNIIETNSENTYKIEDGSLIVTNSKYPIGDKFEEVVEKINVSPDKNVFDFGTNYILEISPIITLTSGEEMTVETIEQDFWLNQLSSAAVGLKMTRQQLKSNSNEKYIRVSISINDKDGIIYGSEWGEYYLHIYKYKDNIDNAIELEYYTDLDSQDSLRGNVFSIKTSAKNYPVYIQPKDVDYEYNYVAELVMKVDSKNKGEDYLQERIEKYRLSAITNSEGVSIGSALFDTVDNMLEIRFYDSYNNIDKIDRIDYYVFEISNNFNQSGTNFKTEWNLVGDSPDGVSYYKTNLPIEISQNEVYTIKLNFYVGDTLVGQVDTSYISQ